MSADWLRVLAVSLLLVTACERGADVTPESLEGMILNGRMDEALESVREALDRDPTRSDLQLFYGKMLVKQNDFYLALWPLREAARDPVYAERAELMIAQTQIAIGNTDEALVALDAVLAREPEHREALELRANAYLEAVRLEEALEETERVLDLDPDDLGVRLTRMRALLLLERVEEADAGLEELESLLAERGDEIEPEMHARVCVAGAVFAREKGDAKSWYDQALACSDAHPTEQVALQEALKAHGSRAEADAVTTRLQRALEAAPESGQIRFLLAEHHRNLGDPEAGERLLREAIEDADPPRARDWRALYEYFWQLKEFDRAVEALEKSIALLPSPTTADLLLLADTLVEAGELERAEQVAGRLKEGYRDLVWGRIHFERGDLERARVSLDEGLRVWPHNPVARVLLARVAARSGDLEEALNQYIEAYRIEQSSNSSGTKGTGAAKEIARIELALGAYEQAAEFAANHLAGQPSDPEGFELVARAGARGGRTDLVNVGLSGLSALPNGHPRAIALQAELVTQAEGPAAALRTIRRWKPVLRDPVNLPVLAAVLEQEALLDRHDRAIELAENIVELVPDNAAFRALHAQALQRAGRDAASVRAATNEALQLSPDQPTALLVLAQLEAEAGRLDAALAACKRAAETPPDSAEAPLRAARLLLATEGREAEARQRLEEILRTHPLEATAAALLAKAELQRPNPRDLDRALRSATRAAQFAGALSPQAASEVYAILGRVHAARGESQQARSNLGFALELDKENAEANAALARLGETEGQQG